MLDQVLISGIILLALFFFIWGRWRHDVVALAALLIAVLLGLISFDEAFLGFVHPVVILVVATLIISKGLINSGAVDYAFKYLKISGRGLVLQLGVLVGFTVLLSAFINSLGALAFVVPIAVKIARQSKTPPSLFLMPLAFASHFGGGITLIGSVSNIIVSGFRAESESPFAFFDFAFVAIPIAIVSIFFIALAGWRLLPKRENIFSQESVSKYYLAEVKVLENSPLLGKPLKDFQNFSKEGLEILALVREEKYISGPLPETLLKEDDILVIETETAVLEHLTTVAGLEFFFKSAKEKEETEEAEVVVPESSFLVGETAKSFNFHNEYQINLLGISRPGSKIKKRLADVHFRPGDILLVQGKRENINQFIRSFNLFTLQEEEFHFKAKKESSLLASGIFASAILLSIAGFFPVHLIFALAAVIMIVSGLVPTKRAYDSVDFSMIILIAVMLQLGIVFYQTGAASSLAEGLFFFEALSPKAALSALLLASILLSDVLSNVTVAALLAPLAFVFSQHFGVSADPFFMAVAIGSGSSYLTPIGHQSNIFVMGLGGYKFSDYWRLGLPLEIITFVLGIFLIPYFWPF